MTSLCLSHPPKPPPTHLATFAISEVPSPCAFIFTQHRQHGDALNLTLASGEPFDRERYEANIGAGPAGMLNGCALVAAHGAPGALSQLVAGGVWAPPDDRRGESHWRIVRTFFAIPHHHRFVRWRSPRVGLGPVSCRIWIALAYGLGKLPQGVGVAQEGCKLVLSHRTLARLPHRDYLTSNASTA